MSRERPASNLCCETGEIVEAVAGVYHSTVARCRDRPWDWPIEGPIQLERAPAARIALKKCCQPSRRQVRAQQLEEEGSNIGVRQNDAAHDLLATFQSDPDCLPISHNDLSNLGA
jgi:hypothetical protein